MVYPGVISIVGSVFGDHKNRHEDAMASCNVSVPYPIQRNADTRKLNAAVPAMVSRVATVRRANSRFTRNRVGFAFRGIRANLRRKTRTVNPPDERDPQSSRALS